jgi:hypothetical protein
LPLAWKGILPVLWVSRNPNQLTLLTPAESTLVKVHENKPLQLPLESTLTR